MSLEITAQCGCGRTMRPDALKGRGHLVCGCGNRVHVDVPNRLAYEPGQCSWVSGRTGCTRPAAGPDVSLCAEHIKATVTFAKEHRVRLRLSIEERTQIAQLERDLAAAPEQQELDRRDRYAASVRAQREAIMVKVAAAGSVVYYVRLDAERIKIGVTVDLPARMNAMRVPRDAVVAAEPGGRAVETRRHAEFAADLLDRQGSREEFRPSAVLTDLTQKLREQHGDPFALWHQLRLDQIADLREAGPLLFGQNADIYDRLEARELARMGGS